jgi:DNA-binding transcriptional MocR family regulator
VAALLEIDLTTVTRAYEAARARGLIEGAIGRGTFVRARAADDDSGNVDLSMNLPPPPKGVSLGALMRETTRAILERTDPSILMAYHPGGGSLGQKTAAAAWLAPCIGEVAADRVLICPGTQTGLAAVLAAVAGRGETLVVEPLVYPGLLALARQFGLRLAICATDERGMAPDALERLCAEDRPAAIYIVPTMHNPTTMTLDLARRREIARVAQDNAVWIIEDDPYNRLLDTPLPAVSSLAPERGIYLATLSKTLSPGLRTAFLVPPPGPVAERIAESLRAIALMPSPLMTSVVSAWIREGVADHVLAGVKREARERRAIAAQVLPKARGSAEGVHVWVDLPPGWDSAHGRRIAQQRGLSLVTADAFAASDAYPNGLRISLGGPARQSVLRGALESVAALIAGAAPPQRVVV